MFWEHELVAYIGLEIKTYSLFHLDAENEEIETENLFTFISQMKMLLCRHCEWVLLTQPYRHLQSFQLCTHQSFLILSRILNIDDSAFHMFQSVNTY